VTSIHSRLSDSDTPVAIVKGDEGVATVYLLVAVLRPGTVVWYLVECSWRVGWPTGARGSAARISFRGPGQAPKHVVW